MKDFSVFDKNMEVLEKCYPAYAEYIRKNESVDDGVVADFFSSNDATVFGVMKDGTLYQLESRYNNGLVFKGCFPFNSDEWELFGKMFMFGFGNGMYARYFLSNFSEDHCICIYEPSYNIFYFVIHYFDIADVIGNDRVQLYIDFPDNEIEYSKLVNDKFDYAGLFTFKYCFYMNYSIIFFDKINEWKKEIEDAYFVISGDHNLYHEHGSMFVDNNYSNYKYFANSKELLGCQNIVPEDVPAFIVSTGPSLSKNINELKAAQGKSVIIALDASATPLARAGITPDVLVAIDPTKGEEYIVEDSSKMVPLVCELNTAKGFVDTHKGTKLFSLSYNEYSNLFIQSLGRDMVPLQTGGSVANTACSLAWFLGCRTIVFVGQDLAFTGGQTHTKGSVRGDEGQEHIDSLGEKVIVLEDVFGNDVVSCYEYSIFKKWFENYIKSHEGIRAIDATEGGAKIEGTQIKTLRETIEEVCTKSFDFGEELQKVKDMFSPDEKKQYVEHLLNINSILEENREKIKNCLEIYDDMRKLVAEGKSSSDEMKKLSAESNTILDELQSDMAIRNAKDLRAEEIDNLHKTVYKTKNNLDEEILDICDVGERYLNLLIEAIDEFEDISNSYEDELKSIISL